MVSKDRIAVECICTRVDATTNGEGSVGVVPPVHFCFVCDSSILIFMHPTPRQNMQAHGVPLQKLLCAAAWTGHVRGAQHLVEAHGADPSVVASRMMSFDQGFVLKVTPVVWAVHGGDHVDMVKYFVDECNVGEEEKSVAVMSAMALRRFRCAAFLSCQGAKPLHGPLPTLQYAMGHHRFASTPLAYMVEQNMKATTLACILNDNTWSKEHLSDAFLSAVRLGIWDIATLLYKAGAVSTMRYSCESKILVALDLALEDTKCPVDLRKALWADRISSEKVGTILLAWGFGRMFAEFLHAFETKAAQLNGIVTRAAYLKVAATITPNPVYQSWIVKGVSPVTAKSDFMSFVLNENHRGLAPELVGRVLSYLKPQGVKTKWFVPQTLTNKMLVRKGLGLK